jgi:hypothetical protein
MLGATVLVVTSCGARSTLERTIHRPPTNPDIVRACMMLYACGGTQGIFTASPDTVSNCIYGALGTGSLLGGSPTISTGFLETTGASCLASATDCAGVRTCIFGSDITCLGAPAPVYCAYEHAVHCTQFGTYGDDCTAPGFLRDGSARCMVTATGNTACAFGQCDPKTTAACDGNVAQHCSDGVLGRWTCPLDSKCGPGTGPSATLGCVGTGKPCTVDQCDDAAVAFCLGGKVLRLDCASLPIPSKCTATNSSGTLGCRPSPDLACDPTQFKDQCDGTSLVYCDGDVRRFDCTTIGFQTCGMTSGVVACMQ